MGDVNGSGQSNDFGRWVNPNCRRDPPASRPEEYRSPFDGRATDGLGEALGISLLAHMVVFAGVVVIVGLVKLGGAL